ncbi:MAG: 50S ribosomal protein L24, partial [Euryarchaeota archaeon CG01_land_8_20_14_3_00_38_12]
PRKQRKMRYNAPIHRRRKMIASHLAEELMLKYNKRSVTVKKGDTVKIIRGGLKGHIGKVASVDTKKMKITMEGATIAKADKSQVARPIDPSNVIITHLDLSDPWRSKKIGEGKIKRKRKIKEKKEEKAEGEKEKKTEEKKEVEKKVEEEKIEEKIEPENERKESKKTELKKEAEEKSEMKEEKKTETKIEEKREKEKKMREEKTESNEEPEVKR